MANKLNRLLSSKERRYKPVASTTSPNKDTTNPTKTPSSESKDASTRIVSTKGSPADISSSSLLNRQNTHGSRLRDDNTETIKRRKSRRMSDKAKSTDSPTARTVETTVYTAKYNGRVSQVDYNDAKKDDQYGVKRERRNSTSSKFNEKSTKSGRSTSRGSRHDNKLSDSDRWSSIPDKLFRKNPLSRKPAISDNDNKREKERGNESEKNNRTSDARDMSGNKSSGRLSSKELRGEKDKSTPRGKPKKEDDKKSSKTKSVKEEDDIVKKKLSSSSSRLTPSAFLKRSQSTKAFKDSSFDLDRSRSKHKPSNKVSEHSSSKRGKDLDKSSSSHAKGGREESLSSSTRGLIQCHTLPDDFAIPPKSSTYRRVDTQSRSKSSHVDRKDDKLVSSHTSRPKSLSRSIHSNASSRDREDCLDAATAAGRATVTGLEIVPRLTSPSDDNMQVGLEIIPMKQPNHANCREKQDKRKSSSSSHHPKSHRRGSSAGTSDTGMTRRKSEIDLLTSQVSLLDFNSSSSHNDNKADDDDDDKNVEDDSGKRRDKEKDRSSFTLTNHDASSRSGMSKTAMSNEKNKRLIKSSINKNTSGRNDIIRKNSYKPKNRSVHLERIDPKSRNISSSQKDDDMSLGTILDKRLNQRRSWSASPPRGMTTDGKKGEEKINNNLQSKRKEPIEPNIPGSSSTQALAPSRVETNNPSRSRQFREGHARRPGHHRRLSGLQRRNSKMRSISPSTRSRDQRNEDKKPSSGPHDAQPPCAKSLADSTLIVREDRKSVSRPESQMQDGRHHDDDRIRRSGPFRRPSLAQRRHSNKYSNELSDHRDRSQSEGKRRYEGERATSNGPLHGPYLAQRWQSKGDSRPLSMLKDESYSEDEVRASPGLRPAHLTRRNSRTLNITSPTSNNESSTLASPLSPQSRQEGVRVTNFGRHPRAPRDVREINTLKSENKSRDEGVRHNRPIRRTTVAHAPDDKLNTSLRSGDSKGNPRHEIESGNHLASMPNILGDDGSQATDKGQPSIISPDYEKIKRLCESIQRQQNMVNSKSNKPTTGKGLDDNALKDLRPLYKDSSALKLEANEVKSLPQPILRHSRIARIPTILPPKKVPPPPPPPRKSISEGEALPQNAVLHSGASVTSGVNQGACSGSPPQQPMSQKVNGNEQLSSFPQNSTTQHVIPASGLPSQTIDPRILNNGPSPANTMNSAPERSLQRSNSSNTIGDTARQARNRKLMALAGGGEKQRVAGLSYNDRVGGRGLYTGEVDQWGRPNGEGKIEYDSGEMFEGQWVNGNRVAPTFCPPTGAPIIPGGSLAPNGSASVAPGSVAPGLYGGGASVAPGSIMGGMYGGGGFMMNPFAQAQFMQQQRMAMGYPMMMQGQGQAMMQHPAQIMYPQMMPRPQFPGQQQQPNQTEDQDSV